MYRPLNIAPHAPNPLLDSELAQLGYTCIRTWPDQRPITPSLVRSLLAAHGQAPPTTLATIRTPDGKLVAAAALRHPSVPGSTGRLWGPLVHPDHQKGGLGRSMLDALSPHLTAARETITTAEIPQDRTAATTFFERSGWQLAHTSTLLKAPLPLPPAAQAPPSTVRGVRPGEELGAKLDSLYAAARPHDIAAARGAWRRWRSDERFRAQCLAVAERSDGLLAAALVYPLVHTHPDEPTEALLGDLLIRPGSQEAANGGLHTARWALSAAAASVGAGYGRAVVADRDHGTLALLRTLGFTSRSCLRHYEAPMPGS